MGPCELLSESGLGCRLGASLVGPSAYGSETSLTNKMLRRKSQKKENDFILGGRGEQQHFLFI